MDFTKFYLFLLTLCGVVVTITWWVAAFKRPAVAVFFWLATIHTVFLGISLFSYLSPALTRWPGFFPLQVVLSFINTALYIRLVRWLLARP